MKKILNLMIAFVCVLSCAFVFSGCDITKCEHTASEEWIMNSTHHWHECSECGEKLDKAEHDWEEIVLVEETLTEKEISYFVCKECGKQEVDIFTVTETEWNTALDFRNYDKIKVSNDHIIIIKDGNSFYSEINGESYYSREDDKYYEYNLVDGIWVKTEALSSEFYEFYNALNIGSILVNEGVEYSELSYNSKLAAYEWEDSSGDYNKMVFYFEWGKLIRVDIIEGDDVGTVLIEYDNIELELPTIG